MLLASNKYRNGLEQMETIAGRNQNARVGRPNP